MSNTNQTEGRQMRCETWQAHIDEVIPATIHRPSLDHGADEANRMRFREWLAQHKADCPMCRARGRTIRSNRAAKVRHQVYTDMGMNRVRGALGGVYYE